MKLTFLYFYTIVSVALVVSNTVTPEVYWKSRLPNTPMPKTVTDLLYTKGTGVYTSQKRSPYVGIIVPTASCLNPQSEDQLTSDLYDRAMYFFEKDLNQGVEMKFHFQKYIDQKVTFLPREAADLIPFSSNNLPQIYNKFLVKSNSPEAEAMKQTLNECENKDIQGEDSKCVTSLESMVDFSITSLGENVQAISTEVSTKESTPLQNYKILGAKKVSPDKSVICHKKSYPYSVFYCHKSVNTIVYAVSMVGVDGTKVKTVAICHTDTQSWNPKHLSFQVLKVKPGDESICHTLSENHVIWVPDYTNKLDQHYGKQYISDI